MKYKKLSIPIFLNMRRRDNKFVTFLLTLFYLQENEAAPENKIFIRAN